MSKMQRNLLHLQISNPVSTGMGQSTSPGYMPGILRLRTLMQQFFFRHPGFVAGLYAKIDNNRGVWKSPAGTETGVSGGLSLLVNLTDQQHGVVNLKGINALRSFVGYGNVVWGARTVSSDISWRYLAVRRMANFLKSSIYDGIQWAVFEPNDAPLWDALRLSIGGFMLNLFKQKAFQGSTPDQAFFVKCDSETTPPSDQEQGIVNILVGFAALKPAEFVIVKLSQKVAQEQT